MPAGSTTSRDAWWRNGVVYHIYPRSFQDSNGDGIGDLQGIRSRLDYLLDLGVDAVWLSPVYPSPMADFGYDVADYCAIDPRFGTLADFDELAASLRARGLKLILDFVPNHTSIQHPWFLESRRSRDNEWRDWYLWRDPAPGGGAPNNWLSQFGGPAWTFDPHTGQYYCHSFLKEQPDLNWRHPPVRAAMYEAMRFWLRRGVDGFRLDVIYCVVKDELFRDNPPNPEFAAGMAPALRLLSTCTADRPEVQDIVAGMRRVVDEFGDDASARVLIAETYLPIDRLAAYYGREADGSLRGAQLPFNFHLIGTPWQAAAIDALIRDYEAMLPEGAAPNWVLGNHDRSRIATRAGAAAAPLAAMLLLTLRGTPTMYYGDEIGLSDVPLAAEDVQDPWEKNEPGFGHGRDPVRTPMPWSAAPEAGFTTATPWLPLNADWPRRNVLEQASEPGSLLQLYRRLIALRRSHPALNDGAWKSLGVAGNTLAYARQSAGERIVVALNFSADEVALSAHWLADCGRVLLSSHPDRTADLPDTFCLRPNEGVVLGT